MSLILRKDCQPALDSIGLNEYHVAINSNQYLEVRCECGKPFVSVAGIKFSRKTPTKDELSYAVVLFTKYLATHKHLLLSYYAKEQAFKNKPVVSLPEGLTISSGYYYNNDNKVSCKWVIGFYTLSFKYDYATQKVIGKYSLGINKEFDLQELKAFKLDEKALKSNLKLLQEYSEYRQENSDLNQEKQNLSICEI